MCLYGLIILNSKAGSFLLSAFFVAFAQKNLYAA